MNTLEVTREEAKRVVKKLQNGKAAGYDRLVAELMKNGGDKMIEWLAELIQEVWRMR